MALNLKTGNVYTFNTKAPGILQATVKNAKMKGEIDYDIAIKYENIDLMYRQIYPALPPGTPDSPLTCTYYLFQSESGKMIVLADQWIDEGTVDLIDGVNFTVTFNNATFADIARVRDILNAATFTNYEIKQI